MKLQIGKKFHMPSPNKKLAAMTRKPSFGKGISSSFIKGIGKPPSMVK